MTCFSCYSCFYYQTVCKKIVVFEICSFYNKLAFVATVQVKQNFDDVEQVLNIYILPYNFLNGFTTSCLRKNCAKLFLSELCQIFINFNNFRLADEKMARIICYINIFHLTSLMPSQYLVKQKSAKFFT